MDSSDSSGDDAPPPPKRKEHKLLDAYVTNSNRCVLSTKHFMLTPDETLTDSIDAILTEFASQDVDDVVIVDGGSGGMTIQ